MSIDMSGQFFAKPVAAGTGVAERDSPFEFDAIAENARSSWKAVDSQALQRASQRTSEPIYEPVYEPVYEPSSHK